MNYSKLGKWRSPKDGRQEEILAVATGVNRIPLGFRERVVSQIKDDWTVSKTRNKKQQTQSGKLVFTNKVETWTNLESRSCDVSQEVDKVAELLKQTDIIGKVIGKNPSKAEDKIIGCEKMEKEGGNKFPAKMLNNSRF